MADDNRVNGTSFYIQSFCIPHKQTSIHRIFSFLSDHFKQGLNSYVALYITIYTALNFFSPDIQAKQESETEDDVDEVTPPGNLSGHVEKLIELRKKLDTEVKGNVCEAQKRQKKQYDIKHQQGYFKVGQSVLMKNMKKLSKKGDRMDPNWTGPYGVAECVGNNCRLRRRETRRYLNLFITVPDRSYSLKGVSIIPCQLM